MKIKPISKPRCSECPCYGYHSDPVPKKIAGAYLKVGSRYCTGGKRARVFKPSDPKRAVPSWCPRRKAPAELRVYCFKDITAWHFNYLYEKRGNVNIPSAFEYAVRHESSTGLTAKEFYDLTQQKLLKDILGFRVSTNEILEIDDGLKPYFFLIRENGIEILYFFDGKRARQNKLDRADLDALDPESDI